MTVLATDYHRLQSEVDALRETVQEMRDALHAAVNGELAPAEAYVAAGVLGVRDLEPGAAVFSWEARNVSPHAEFAQQITRILSLPEGEAGVLIRRLYVEPYIAPHFHIVGVHEQNFRRLLGGGSLERDTVPCQLFATRYGSPCFNWKFQHGDTLDVHIVNTSGRPLHFRMLALGCYLRGEAT